MISLRWGSASDTGRVRSINEDRALVAEPIFAVADGMGGHAAGEVASQVAVEAMRASAEPTMDGLVEGIRLANTAVWERAEADAALRGMGTTMTALALVPGGPDDGGLIVIANVGDSRAYLFRDGDLTQITRDHSLVEDLVQEGRLSETEARTHPQRNIVTRVLGNEPNVQVDPFPVDPLQGDRFVLCSDGLSNEIDDATIASTLRRIAEPEEAAQELVRLANEAGGRDNTTVVVVDVVDDGGRSRAASKALANEPGTAVHRVVTIPDDPSPPPPPSRTDGAARAEAVVRPRRVTWRSALFTALLLGVLGAAVGAVWFFSRSTYYVGVDGDEVAIYRGRPDGLLWIDPTLEERTGVGLADVPPSRLGDLEAGKEQATLGGARAYVENLVDQSARERGATTTTVPVPASTTTTTALAPLPTPVPTP